MLIKFYSFTPSGNVKFESNGTYNNDILEFIDKSVENTKILFKVLSDGVEFKRVGSTNMDMILKIGKETIGHYKKDDLEFDFKILTHNIEVLDDKISIIYEMNFNGETLGIYKIFIVKK